MFQALEKFSCNTREVSAALDSFTQSLQDTEFPNDVDATQQLLNSQVIFKQCNLQYPQKVRKVLASPLYYFRG
jgi:hypothetical protein